MVVACGNLLEVENDALLKQHSRLQPEHMATICIEIIVDDFSSAVVEIYAVVADFGRSSLLSQPGEVETIVAVAPCETGHTGFVEHDKGGSCLSMMMRRDES